MRTRHWWICLPGAALLGAVSASGLPATTADAVMRQVGLRVGQWHTVVRITGAQAVPATPGGQVPSRIQSDLRAKVGSVFETDDCIGTRGGAHGNLILPGINIGGECALSNVQATTSKLKLDAVCGRAYDGFQARTSVQADIAGTTMNAAVRVSARARDAGVITNLTIATSSRYVGQCRPR